MTVITSASLLIAACGCSDESNAVTPDVPVVKAEKRTVLVYMVATNNLGSGGFDDSDLAEMKAAAAAGELGEGGRLLAYHASDYGVVLKEITAAGIDTLQVYDTETPSVSVSRMRQVIDDMKAFAPADEYAMVFWSHATGWIQDGIAEDQMQSPVLYSYGADGQRNPKKMNITSLASALRGAGLSYLYFDCCYMGSVEVAYELRDCADYIVASPTEDPADGMPYHLTAKHMFNPDLNTRQIALNMAETTFNHYNDVFVKGDCPCTMTVIDTSRLDALASATRNLYKKADICYQPGYSYQKFQTNSNCYYFDFGDYVESISNDSSLLSEWKKALDDAVIYASATPWVWSSFTIDKNSGLSTYIMTGEGMSTIQNYDTLSWYGDVASYLFK